MNETFYTTSVKLFSFLSSDTRRMIQHVPSFLRKCADNFGSRHRHWHNLDHVIRHCEESSEPRMQLAGIFHDWTMKPRAPSGKNEEDSVGEFLKACDSDLMVPDVVKSDVVEIIRATGNPREYLIDHRISLPSVFVKNDWSVLLDGDTFDLTDYENRISKEFQCVGWEAYKKGRLSFLDKYRDVISPEAYEYLPAYIAGRKPRVGIYAGSFNPFHVGHLSVLREAEKHFDFVYLAIGCDPNKEGAYTSLANRSLALSSLMQYHHVVNFSGLMVWTVKELEAQGLDVTVVRGLRTDTDFKREEVDLRVSQDIYPNLKVIWLPCEKRYEHVSSSMIRQIKSIDPNEAKRYMVWEADAYAP